MPSRVALGYQRGYGMRHDIWHDTKRPESFWAMQEPMGHRRWCLVPEFGQLHPSAGWSSPKGWSALTTRHESPFLPQHIHWGLPRLTAGPA